MLEGGGRFARCAARRLDHRRDAAHPARRRARSRRGHAGGAVRAPFLLRLAGLSPVAVLPFRLALVGAALQLITLLDAPAALLLRPASRRVLDVGGVFFAEAASPWPAGRWGGQRRSATPPPVPSPRRSVSCWFAAGSGLCWSIRSSHSRLRVECEQSSRFGTLLRRTWVGTLLRVPNTTMQQWRVREFSRGLAYFISRQDGHCFRPDNCWIREGKFVRDLLRCAHR